jgi:DNA-directed RNA polymerases I, II, and III subunit RPABC2
MSKEEEQPEFPKIKELTIVSASERRTSDKMTAAEYTEIISVAALQLANGERNPWVDIGDETNPILIAEMEVKMRKCPLCIERVLGNDTAEIWKVNEMIIP